MSWFDIFKALQNEKRIFIFIILTLLDNDAAPSMFLMKLIASTIKNSKKVKRKNFHTSEAKSKLNKTSKEKLVFTFPITMHSNKAGILCCKLT